MSYERCVCWLLRGHDSTVVEPVVSHGVVLVSVVVRLHKSSTVPHVGFYVKTDDCSQKKHKAWNFTHSLCHKITTTAVIPFFQLPYAAPSKFRTLCLPVDCCRAPEPLVVCSLAFCWSCAPPNRGNIADVYKLVSEFYRTA